MMGRYAGISAGNWPLDGNSNDISGNANNGFNEANVSWVNGRYGQAGDFSGTASGIDLPNNASLKPTVLTVSVWFKGTPTNGTFMENWFVNASKFYGFLFDIDATFPRLVISKGTGNTLGTDFEIAASPIACNDDIWHMLTGTFDGNNIKFYFDGVLVDTQSYAATLTYAATQYPMIGIRQDTYQSWSYPVDGILDELFLLPYVWTEQDVRRWYAYSKGLLV